MIEHLDITVLVENRAGRRNVLAEHGLALWLEVSGRNILFDTGQGMALPHNAEALGVDLANAHDVVLSHGHYDHTGGLAAMRDLLHATNLYVHPAAFQPKFAVADGVGGRYSGSPLGSIEELQRHIPSIVPTPGPTRIAEGVWVSGEIPRRNDFEDVGGPFYLDEGGTIPDALVDDQAMYIETAKGIVVLLGCAHAGLVNTLDYIADIAGQRGFHAVLGGMHLGGASEERIARSIATLRDYDLRVIAPVHCTGPRATARIRDAFPDRFVELSSGSVISFPEFGRWGGAPSTAESRSHRPPAASAGSAGIRPPASGARGQPGAPGAIGSARPRFARNRS